MGPRKWLPPLAMTPDAAVVSLSTVPTHPKDPTT